MKKMFLTIFLSTLIILNLSQITRAFDCPLGMEPDICATMQAQDNAQNTECEKLTKENCKVKCFWSTTRNKCESQLTGIYTKCSDALKKEECKLVPTNLNCSWNAATEQCTGEENTLYTALDSIYETGTGWVSGLLSKSGANKYNVIVDIPCDKAIVNIIGGASCATTAGYTGDKNTFPLYIARLYQFGFGIVGAVALLMIIIGAAKYTLSAGNFASKDEAKKQITEAIYGVLLLFGAYLILYTINPGLVSISAPTLTPVSVNNLSTPTATQTTTNTNTPTEDLATKYTFIENCDTTKNSVCVKCNSGYVLVSGKCEKATPGVCSSGYNLPNGKCAPCSSVNGYDGPNGTCVLCSSGYIVSGIQCIAE